MQAPYDIFEFEGAKAMNGTIKTDILVDASSGTDLLAATITSDAHGLTATYSKNPCIIIQNLADDDYNGLRTIIAVATNTFTIKLVKAFVALDPAGTELWSVGITYPDDWEFLGYELHMSDTGTTAENLTMTKDAYAGAIFDNLILTQAMAAIKDLEDIHLGDPRPMKGGDIIKFAYANTSVRVWGMKLYGRRCN